MDKIKYWTRWLFQDLTQRKGKYVIAEVPNGPLLVFMITLIISVILYPGMAQRVLFIISYVALLWWGILEARSGRSRFRKLLGILGIIAAIGATALLFAR